MVDESGSYRIGIREVYGLLTELATKLDRVTSEQSMMIAKNSSSIDTMGRALQEMWTRIDRIESGETARDREWERKLEGKGAGNWQVNLAIGSSMIAVFIAVIQLVAK